MSAKMNLLKSWTVPIEIFNEAAGKYANQHWSHKKRRHNSQNFQVYHYLKEITDFQNKSIHLKLIRISSRMLDSDDNLPYAFKWCKDCLADMLVPGLKRGRADDSKLLTWSYGQEKGKPKEKGMRLEMYEKNLDSCIYIPPKSDTKAQNATIGVKFSQDIFLMKSFLDQCEIKYVEKDLENGPFGKHLRIKREKNENNS